MNKNITIVALATSPFNCAIHVIRLSGSDAYSIINKITDRKIDKEGYKIQMSNIIDENKQMIDNVLLMKFVAPKSFTGEDLIEINCHGGIYIANKIIQQLIIAGAKYAKHGEYTQRALFNGKMNLIEAESINNLINANNDVSIKMAIGGMNKNLTNKIKKMSERIFTILGQIEVNIDYPEYDDVVQTTNKSLIINLLEIENEIKALIKQSDQGIKVQNGFKIVIIGKPNVGKSSLLNVVLNQNKAIVSNIPGTTRDIVEGETNYNGITYKFFDTAGIRDSDNQLEKIGIKKTQEAYKTADLILFVIDGSHELEKDDLDLQKMIKKFNHLTIINKSDLKKKVNVTDGIIFSSKKDNSDVILEMIEKKINISSLQKSDLIVLQNARQIGTLQNALDKISLILKQAKNNVPIDLLAEYLHEVYELTESLLMTPNQIDFLDKLFANFCLGK